MNVEFGDKDLGRLEVDENFGAGFSAEIVKMYRRRLLAIRSSVDERALRSIKSLHFEKLKGARSHQYSMRLNQQWRLVFEIAGFHPNKTIIIVSIEDYH